MTEEFKKHFDALSNIAEAIDLAYELGYYEAYLDGGCITSPTYIAEMRKKITSLVGGNWPKEVLDSYSKGIVQGDWES